MDFLKKAFEALTGQEKDKDLGPISDTSGQPQDQVELVSYIKQKILDVRNSGSRVSHEGVWMTNYAYLLGFDSVYYDTNTRQYRVVGRNSQNIRRNRIHVNKVLPTVQRRQARLCKNPPRYEVRPDDSSQDAKDVARLEQQVLEMYMEKERVMEKRLNMMIGLQQCGHYFMGVNWNTEKGELISAEVEEQDNSNGQIKKKIDYEYEGDIDIELIHPLEVFPDPLATTIEECQWLIRAKVRKLDYFRTHYPERGALVKEEEAWLLSSQYEMRLQSLIGQGPAQTGIQVQMQNSAIEMIYYEKRSKKHPNGRMAICANGVLLHDGPLPVGEIPLVKFDDIPITGKFYSEALVTHLRPIQDQYNRLISKRADWTNKLLAGKYLVARGAGLSQEALTDQSGEVLYYNPVPNAAPPTAINTPVMPQYAYNEEDRLNAMFYDIAGEGEISRGILPAAGIPAVGMQLLLEQDETRIAAITEQHEHAFAKLGRIVLLYAEKFISNERLLKISDPNFQYLVKKYKGDDLSSKHDVIVIRGSLAPTSKAVRRNDLLNLYAQGLLGDPNSAETRSRVLRDLEFGDTASVWQDQSIDMAQIKKSIEMIEKGLVPEVSELDNHPLHIQEKNRYRKSDKFNLLDPERQAILLADIDAHVKELMKLTAPQFGMSPARQDDLAMAGIPEDTMTAEEQLQPALNNLEADAEGMETI